MNRVQRLAEFDRQVEVLLKKGYPKAAGMTAPNFLRQITPLRKAAGKLFDGITDLETGRLSFVLVVQSDLVPAQYAMGNVVRESKKGVVALKPLLPADFRPINPKELPGSSIYLMVDIDRGQSTLNVKPEAALKSIRRKKRSPLTIDEGVAILTQFPDFLQKNNCFSLLASRAGDQRVPAIWIDGEKRPKLGWCWDRNPHTWLGSASCGGRLLD